jgi:hypothetical protein
VKCQKRTVARGNEEKRKRRKVNGLGRVLSEAAVTSEAENPQSVGLTHRSRDSAESFLKSIDSADAGSLFRRGQRKRKRDNRDESPRMKEGRKDGRKDESIPETSHLFGKLTCGGSGARRSRPASPLTRPSPTRRWRSEDS